MIMSQCGLLLFLGEKNPRMQQESRKRNSLKEVKRPISCVDPLNLWCVYCKLDIIIIIIKQKYVLPTDRNNAMLLWGGGTMWHKYIYDMSHFDPTHALNKSMRMVGY